MAFLVALVVSIPPPSPAGRSPSILFVATVYYSPPVFPETQPHSPGIWLRQVYLHLKIQSGDLGHLSSLFSSSLYLPANVMLSLFTAEQDPIEYMLLELLESCFLVSSPPAPGSAPGPPIPTLGL